MDHPEDSLVDIHQWEGQGYQPLVFSDGWMAARLNWEPLYELDNLGEIERHNQTDEVFVLWRGRGALLVSDGSQTQVIDMQPGSIYNVRKAVWHALLASRDASWIIVENRDTHLKDTEIRQMDDRERRQFMERLPVWVEAGWAGKLS